MAAKDRDKLKAEAVKDLHESKFSGVKKVGGLCDKVTDEQYVTTYGTASPSVAGSKRTLPAIVVRHLYTCVINALAVKQLSEQWVILALDSEFDSVRCVRTGPPHIIVKLYEQCEFVPDNGLSPFPPPEQIEELWRKDYRQAIAALESQPSSARPAASIPQVATSAPADAAAWEDFKPLFLGPECHENPDGMVLAPWGNQRSPVEEDQTVSPDGKSMKHRARFSDGSTETLTYYRQLADCRKGSGKG